MTARAFRGTAARGMRLASIVLGLLVPTAAVAQQADPRAAAPANALTEMSLEELLDVMVFESKQQVTAVTKEAQTSADAPAIVTVIARAAIEARGFRSVGEALASVPGLFVIDDLITANVAVRGIYAGPDSWSRTVKVLIDGQPVTSYSTGGTLLGPELIPIDAVEAIEVLRGPASALYGANAFLGVVNIVTRVPTAGATVRLGGEAGAVRDRFGSEAHLLASLATEGETRAHLLLAMSSARLDRSGLAVPSSSPDIDRYRGETSEGDLSQPLSLLARGSIDRGALGGIDLQLVYQRLDAHAAFSDIGVLTPENRVAADNTVARVGYRNAFLERRLALTLSSSVSVAQELPTQVLDAGDAAFTLRRRRFNRAYQSGAELSYGFGRHELRCGVDYLVDRDHGDTTYRVSRTDGAWTRRSLGERFTYTTIGYYAQAVARPLDGLGLVAGVRYDINSRWEDSWSTRIGATYAARDDLRLKLLYGTSFVPPSPTQLYAEPLRGGGVRGNPDLDSQRARTVEASANYHVGDVASVEVTGSWTEIQDRIDFVASGSNLTARNLTDSHSLGSEAVVEVNWAPAFVRANLSYQHTRVEVPVDAPSWWSLVYDGAGAGGLSPPAVPTWMGHVTAGMTLPPQHLQGSATVHLVGERKASQANIRVAAESYVLAPYATVDLNVRSFDLVLLGGQPTDVSLHVTNVFDRRYAEAGALGVDMPALGRTVFARLTQSF